MLEFKLYYENTCNEEEYKPIQDAILAGKNWVNVCEKFDDWIVSDEATVDLAIKLGWNAEKYISDCLHELIEQYIEYDAEITTSARRLLVNESLKYINDYLTQQLLQSKITPCDGTTEYALAIGDKYFIIHDHSDGWDYYLLDSDYNVIEEGIYDDVEAPLGKTLKTLMEEPESVKLNPTTN